MKLSSYRIIYQAVHDQKGSAPWCCFIFHHYNLILRPRYAYQEGFLLGSHEERRTEFITDDQIEGVRQELIIREPAFH